MNYVYLSFPSLPSTNDYLKDHYSTLASGTVVSTKHQTKGKGRLGRIWVDDDGSLLFSFLLKEEGLERLLHLLPLIAGASIEKMLLEEGIDAKIKWPNDIFINDKKCCGVLVEGISDSSLKAVVVGIGINLNNESFLSELDSATSLYRESGKRYEKKDVMQKILKYFDEFLNLEKHGTSVYYPLLKEYDYLKGKKILLNYYGENRLVTALEISKNGALMVKDENEKTIMVTAGEATIIKTNRSSLEQ